MEKIIKIGDKEVKISNNVAWLMEYREQFGKDITQELIPLMSTVSELLTGSLAAYRDGKLYVNELSEVFQGRGFEVMTPLYQSEPTVLVPHILWAMAKAADETIDPPKKWVRQFDAFPFDEIVPVLWTMNAEGFTSSKNLMRLRTLIERAKEALGKMKDKIETQPSHSTTSSSPELSED